MNKVTNINLHKTMTKIFEHFKENVQARRGESWAPSSPDLNPCDFFLWGYMKELVYKPLPTSLHQLKEKITLTFRNIPEPMVQKAVYGMKKRAKKLVKTGGQVFEGKQIRIQKKTNVDKELIENYEL